MFAFHRNHEPPLHQAVLQERYDDLLSLSQSKELLEQQNTLGFTALELACLLDKKQCLDILQPKTPRTVKLVLKGEYIVKKCSVQQFEERMNIKYLPHLHFTSYASLKEVISNCPWILKSSRWGEENRTLGTLYQKEIKEGKVADVTIQWIDDVLGYGVFSNRDLLPGTYIGEYTGIVRRLNRLHPDHNAYCFHYPTRFWSWKYFIIDALHAGNEMRFINHSNTPNLQPQCIVDRGMLHLVFLAAQPIDKGMQLTFNYGPDFWQQT